LPRTKNLIAPRGFRGTGEFCLMVIPNAFTAAICAVGPSSLFRPTIITRHFAVRIVTTSSTNGNASSARKNCRVGAERESFAAVTNVGSIIGNFVRPMCCLRASGYPRSQTVILMQKTPIRQALFSPSRRVAIGIGRTIRATAGSGEHVVTIVGKEGDYRIVERRLIPAQTATTLEAAKKLALNVALWTFGLNSRRKTRPKPAQPPINLIGGYRFQGAELDPDLRRDIIVTESDADWLDWPPSDGGAE
jgi:hypothetical protein